MTTSTATDKDVTEVEKIKAASRYLRGTITDGLADPITGSIAESDTQLTKFHGIYQQDDRDYRNERRKQKLEPYYVFMIRVAVPGGICSPHQWLELDRLSRTYADGTLRLTTRQSFQLHHVLKRHLKYSIREINETLLTTLSACGDVNRNVMCSPNPYQSPVHRQVYAVSKEVSEHLKPRTSAYHEIWLNGELVESRQDDEPIYGRTYLPRKFKIAFAIPPRNDVDVFAHDLGFIAVVKDDRLLGFNVSTGGGMGMTHNVVETYPRLADVIGFCSTGQVIEVAENVVKIQRDNGDRTDRKHARFKYTIDDRGTDWLKAELNNRLGWQLQPARPYQFESMGDRYGWLEGTNGNWFLTLFIQNGRVADTPDYPMMTGIREIAKIHDGDFRLTPNQNLMIGDILPRNRTKIKKLLRKYKLHDTDHQTGLRLNSMACVAFPTCGLAMAESERCLPGLLARLDKVMKEAGLHDDPIVVRMSGCPNGCSRPYNAEIAFVGKAPNNYNMYMGASFTGNRLSKLYRESLSEDRIVEELTPIIHRYAAERHDGERFGDFVIRTGYVTAVTEGKHFHD